MRFVLSIFFIVNNNIIAWRVFIINRFSQFAPGKLMTHARTQVAKKSGAAIKTAPACRSNGRGVLCRWGYNWPMYSS